MKSGLKLRAFGKNHGTQSLLQQLRSDCEVTYDLLYINAGGGIRTREPLGEGISESNESVAHLSPSLSPPVMAFLTILSNPRV